MMMNMYYSVILVLLLCHKLYVWTVCFGIDFFLLWPLLILKKASLLDTLDPCSLGATAAPDLLTLLSLQVKLLGFCYPRIVDLATM